MAIRSAVALFALVAPLFAQVDQEPPAKREPTPREIGRQAAREIKAIAKDGELEQIQALLREKGLIDDTDVVRAVGKLLDDDRKDVRWAAIRTLRYNPNAKAGSELLSAAKQPNIRALDSLFAEVLRGIGQHGDPRALRLLAEGFGPAKEATAITDARIDAVGRIQTPAAVDALIKFARSGFAKGMDEQICTALQGQTGETLGNEMKPWVLWWNRAKLGYRFPETPPTPPAAWARIWEPPTPENLFEESAAPSRPTTGQGGRGGRGRGGAGGGDAGGGGI